jgi:hypothetical protein
MAPVKSVPYLYNDRIIYEICFCCVVQTPWSINEDCEEDDGELATGRQTRPHDRGREWNRLSHCDPFRGCRNRIEFAQNADQDLTDYLHGHLEGKLRLSPDIVVCVPINSYVKGYLSGLTTRS